MKKLVAKSAGALGALGLMSVAALAQDTTAAAEAPAAVSSEVAYIFNTLLIAWRDAAGRLLTGEIAEVEAIDKSWMINFNTSTGPFGVLDNVGLDTAWHITSSRRNPASKAFATVLKTYIDQGKLGAKSGEGFYKYPHPSYQHPDFLK